VKLGGENDTFGGVLEMFCGYNLDTPSGWSLPYSDSRGHKTENIKRWRTLYPLACSRRHSDWASVTLPLLYRNLARQRLNAQEVRP
jgi:hypothetical protein